MSDFPDSRIPTKYRVPEEIQNPFGNRRKHGWYITVVAAASYAASLQS